MTKPSPLKLNAKTGAVEFHGRPITVTPPEFRMLALLKKANGAVVRRADLLEVAAADPDDLPDAKILDVRICTLRKKLSKIDPSHGIETAPGTGYAFRAPREEIKPLPPRSTFHRTMMEGLDNATYQGATLPGGIHYVMLEVLRRANMKGAPLQSDAEVVAAMHAFYTAQAKPRRIRASRAKAA